MIKSILVYVEELIQDVMSRALIPKAERQVAEIKKPKALCQQHDSYAVTKKEEVVESRQKRYKSKSC